MRHFTYQGLPTQVTFGTGTVASLPAVLEQQGVRRALLLSTSRQAEQARAATSSLGDTIVGAFEGATMHTPVEVTARAHEALMASGADGVVAFGGGSTIGLGKALAVRGGVRHIAVPTTYAGSEMTPILGETTAGRKTTRRAPEILPHAVVYDVNLTLGLPPGISGTSGINAIAHAVEGLYARDTNPVMQLVAQEGIRALAAALPRIVANGGDVAARTEALYGAWLCGMVLGSVGMALHHKLCHTLGGSFDLPHAETHSIVLPHVLAYNAPAIPEAMAMLRTALGDQDPAGALHRLARQVGAPRSLRDLGMPEPGIETATEQALENAYWNPRPLERAAIRDLIARAWAGDPPVANESETA
ncbi:maleylacetate reductase [Novosphingobium humi]|uniref:Maleylacetate reductase n=1 Tax=Novosphingobium humi TaxID=2282397 RepID=A0ABY7U1Y7_9SPHN|nr:maleylacetate reductase [Novosphingobium humi]WCT79238.1 maleylacetate reductase [Novosphingobium humi]